MEYEIGASAYALSNPSMLLCSCLKASLDVKKAYLPKFFYLKNSIKIFDEAGIENLRNRSKILTAYMESLFNRKFDKNNNGLPTKFYSYF